MNVDIEISALKKLLQFSNDVQAIQKESQASEEPEVSILCFVANGGLVDFKKNILDSLYLPEDAVKILVDGADELYETASSCKTVKLLLNKFEHFHKIIVMLSNHYCFSDGTQRTLRWKENEQVRE